MKKVKIMGREFELRDGDEVTYGAQKLVQHERNVVELAILSNDDIKKRLREDTKEGEKKKEWSNEEAVMMLKDIKKSLIDAQDVALMPEEEVIMLSVCLSRDEIGDLPTKVVKELAKAADDALGGLENFTNALTTNST